jgi:hypothetical protein
MASAQSSVNEGTFFRKVLIKTNVSFGHSNLSFVSLDFTKKTNSTSFPPFLACAFPIPLSLIYFISVGGIYVLWSVFNSVNAYSTWIAIKSKLSSQTSHSTLLHQCVCPYRFASIFLHSYLAMFISQLSISNMVDRVEWIDGIMNEAFVSNIV